MKPWDYILIVAAALAVVLVIALAIAMVHMAGRRTPAEQRADDAEQLAYLAEYRRRRQQRALARRARVRGWFLGKR